MDYQYVGTIGVSTTHTTDFFSQKTVQQGETRLELLATSQGTIRLELLASPRVWTLRGMTPFKPLTSPHGKTPLKTSARSWVLTSYYLLAYIPTHLGWLSIIIISHIWYALIIIIIIVKINIFYNGIPIIRSSNTINNNSMLPLR